MTPAIRQRATPECATTRRNRGSTFRCGPVHSRALHKHVFLYVITRKFSLLHPSVQMRCPNVLMRWRTTVAVELQAVAVGLHSSGVEEPRSVQLRRGRKEYVCHSLFHDSGFHAVGARITCVECGFASSVLVNSCAIGVADSHGQELSCSEYLLFHELCCL